MTRNFILDVWFRDVHIPRLWREHKTEQLARLDMQDIVCRFAGLESIWLRTPEGEAHLFDSTGTYLLTVPNHNKEK